MEAMEFFQSKFFFSFSLFLASKKTLVVLFAILAPCFATFGNRVVGVPMTMGFAGNHHPFGVGFAHHPIGAVSPMTVASPVVVSAPMAFEHHPVSFGHPTVGFGVAPVHSFHGGPFFAGHHDFPHRKFIF